MAKQYQITFSGEDLEHIEEMSWQLGVSKSEFIRTGLKFMALYAKTQTEKDTRLILEKEGVQWEIVLKYGR